MICSLFLNRRALLVFLVLFFIPVFNFNFGFSLKPYMLGILVIFVTLILSDYSFWESKNKVWGVICLYFLYFALTAIWGNSDSIRMIAAMLLMLALVVVSSSYLMMFDHVDVQYSLIIAIKFILIFSCLYYCAGLFQWYDYKMPIQGNFLGMTIDRHMPRMIGFMRDPNFFSIFCTIAFFVFKSYRIYFGWIILSVVCLLLSMSTAGILGFVVALGVYFMFIDSEKHKIMIASIVIVLFSLFLFSYVFFYEELQLILYKKMVSLQTGSGRYAIWKAGLGFFMENPIFGNGLFTFKDMHRELFGFPKYAHNTFIEIVVEGGIVGLTLFVALNYFLLRKAWELKQHVCWLFPVLLAFQVQFLSLSLFVFEIYYLIAAFVIYFLYSHEPLGAVLDERV